MKREIVLDTETTGLHLSQGHRLIEIGCVELCGGVSTKKTFHCYINPERDVDPDAERIHGLNISFLKTHPTFSAVAQNFLNFIQDSPLVIHNARFDMAFLNAELAQCGLPVLSNPVIDTLLMAREKFPGSPASLDALCRQFGIDSTHRMHHGALLDARLLSQVYIELTGGKQTTISFTQTERIDLTLPSVGRTRREPRSFPVSQEEEKEHKKVLAKLKP